MTTSEFPSLSVADTDGTGLADGGTTNENTLESFLALASADRDTTGESTDTKNRRRLTRALNETLALALKKENTGTDKLEKFSRDHTNRNSTPLGTNTTEAPESDTDALDEELELDIQGLAEADNNIESIIFKLQIQVKDTPCLIRPPTSIVQVLF